MSPSDGGADGVEEAVRHCYSTWGGRYYDDYYGDAAAYPPVHRDILVGLLEEAGARSVLDAGCGPASFLRALSGRGMELLLSDTVRNYLPEDWAQLVDAMNGVQGAFGALARDVNATVERNAVLSQAALNDLAAPEREALIARRRSVAVLEALARTALANASDRFGRLQQLIDAIPRATDEKAVLDLQARIGAEQGMLTNESTKLQVLYQAAQVEAMTAKQRADEQAIADIGHLMDLPPMGLR